MAPISVKQQRKITVGPLDVIVAIELHPQGWKVTATSIPSIEAWGSSQQQAINEAVDQVAKWYAQSSSAAERRVASALEDIPDTEAAGLDHPVAATPEEAAADSTPVDTLVDLPPDVSNYTKGGEVLWGLTVWYLQKNPSVTGKERTRKAVATDLLAYVHKTWGRVPLVRGGSLPPTLSERLSKHVEDEVLTSYYNEYLAWAPAGEERDVFGKT